MVYMASVPFTFSFIHTSVLLDNFRILQLLSFVETSNIFESYDEVQSGILVLLS